VCPTRQCHGSLPNAVRGSLRTGVVVLAVLACGAVLAAADQKPTAAQDAFAQNKGLGRGVNIIGYDPLWKSPAKARFQDRHFALIKQAWFDHVRINLHPFRDTKMDPDHKLSGAWLATLDGAVQQALANRLLVILDFHEFQAMGENPEANQDRFFAFWRQVAERYKDQPSEVLFEILNEPNKKLTPELWNQFLREALAIIRQTNPTRTVVIGPASWNNINLLDKLELPENDRQLIATVHYYNPFAFTHQGAPWTGNKDKVGVPWNGTESEQQAIARDFDKAQTWARKHNRPLYLGEFGAYDRGDMDSRVRWTSFVARHAEELGWSWGYWQFDGDFIVYDMKNQKWVEPIRDALIPPAK
jgi:endoglucanase